MQQRPKQLAHCAAKVWEFMFGLCGDMQKPRGFRTGAFVLDWRDAYVFGRPCSDLLSQVLRLSTIGAEEFDGRVRDGIGSWAPRKNHKVSEKHKGEFWFLILI